MNTGERPVALVLLFLLAYETVFAFKVSISNFLRDDKIRITFQNF
jgi:hypothetical protein